MADLDVSDIPLDTPSTPVGLLVAALCGVVALFLGGSLGMIWFVAWIGGVRRGAAQGGSDAVSENAPRTLSTETLAMLELRVHSTCCWGDAPTCSICQDQIAKGEQIRVLPCTHGFHSSCVDVWLLTRSPQCPLCKTDTLERIQALCQNV
ncbi:hypothetical protein M427DRAFT_39117 [Gonapodya prolifera JEL478]|uniref:RING-type domain-containing protein n=1 Tax=Gonapodya prolifera (strain JEL478) TaxID=1344416 RepID=A0A138ZY14_GONPJ|nr:hypothetical protein M427DRAFT_39117 [Gonapodya prolifera JEL478]|eukprot:KXS09341.1 hypothetical protein M427DRAFT_39117 [Gonapodya prolifera JEL478]